MPTYILDKQDRLRLLQIAADMGVAPWDLSAFVQDLETYVATGNLPSRPSPEESADEELIFTVPTRSPN